MRMWLPFLALSLLHWAPARSQDGHAGPPVTLVGHWESATVDGGNDRELTRVSISQTTDGRLAGTLDWAASWRERLEPESHVRSSRKSEQVRIRPSVGRGVAFDLNAVSGNSLTGFQGTVSDDGNVFDGWWTNALGPVRRATFHRIPESGALPYRETTYTLSFYSADRVDESGTVRPACVGLQLAGAGGKVGTKIVLRREGDEWAGRAAASADDTLVIRLKEGEGAPVTGALVGTGSRRVVGWASGTATNTAPATPFDDRRRRISLENRGGEPVLEGSIASGVSSDGIVRTDATFIAANGSSFVCEAGTIFWWMTRDAPE